MPGGRARRDVVVGEVEERAELGGAQRREFTQTVRVIARPFYLVKLTGQAALEFESEVRGVPPVRSQAHFYVRGLPMAFNRLGSAIKAWLSDTSEPLRVEWEDGWE